jgi:hypothetical protein
LSAKSVKAQPSSLILPREMLNFLASIKKQQQADGSFLDAVGLPSIIYTAAILSGLNFYARSTQPLVPAVAAALAHELENIRIKAAAFLLAQKNNNWRLALDNRVNFYVLAVLAEYDKDLIGGKALALILKELITLESEPGGPYYLSVGERPEKIDLAVNAGVAKFLSFFEVELPNLRPYQNLLATVKEVINVFVLSLTPALAAAVALTDVMEKSLISEPEGKKEGTPMNEAEAAMMREIIKTAEKRFAGLSGEFSKLALKSIKKTIARNIDKQMSLMAFFTKKSWGEKADKIPDELIAQMGLANIFFWTAFVIYDDFWDEDEAADPKLLPVANFFVRSYVDFFSSLLPEKTGFRIFFQITMDGLDEANNWETIHCRAQVHDNKFVIPDQLPDYGNYDFKYRPASGHILGPVAIFLQIGYGLDSPEVKNLIEYFRNYLIAMQINDDSHDWEEDLRRGHISTVVAMLLEDLNWPKKEIDLEADLPELKKVFWLKTIGRAAQAAVVCAKKSKQALRSIAFIEDYAPLERYADLVAAVAQKAIDEQQKSADFLRAY